jgi:Protein of unknown function (DUF1579)
MKEKVCLAAATFVIAAWSLGALPEDKKPEPTKTAAAEAPKPPAEVEALGYFLGPWTSEGEIKPGPMGPGGPMQGRDICRFMPGRFFVGCMMESKSPMGLMQVQGIMGYDAEKKVYRWWSFDNLGRAETATGTLKNGTWTWSGDSKMGEKVYKTRYTISDTRPDGYSFDFASSTDGKSWTPVMTGKVTKVVPKPMPTAMPGARPPAGAPSASPPAPAPTKKN